MRERGSEGEREREREREGEGRRGEGRRGDESDKCEERGGEEMRSFESCSGHSLILSVGWWRGDECFGLCRNVQKCW